MPEIKPGLCHPYEIPCYFSLVEDVCSVALKRSRNEGGEATAVLIFCLGLCSLMGKKKLFLYCESVDAKGICVTKEYFGVGT